MFKKTIAVFRSFSSKLTDDAVTAYSSDTTLYIVISFFPFLMFLLTLLKYLPFTEAELVGVVYDFIPSQIAEIISRLINELYSTSSIVLSVTIIMTLWTASRGILGIYRGLNSIYGIEETRNYFFLRLRAMLYTLVFSLMLILLLGLYVFGNQIVLWVSSLSPKFMLNKYTILVVSFRSTIGTLVLMIFFIIMYNFIPNRRTRFFSQLPGAIFGAVGWVVFSYLYSFYIDNMSNIKATYGSLTAIVLCVLWLYFCMYLFFLGAELNSILEIPAVKQAVRHFLGKRDRENGVPVPAKEKSSSHTPDAGKKTSEPEPVPEEPTQTQTDTQNPIEK